MLEYLKVNQTTTEEWNKSKCEGDESRKNWLNNIWLKPKYCNNR